MKPAPMNPLRPMTQQPGVDHVDRLDLGDLHVGTIAEARARRDLPRRH